VLINLLGNEIKFTHQGSVTLKVGKVDVNDSKDELDHLEVQPAGIEYPEYAIRFQIEDTGVGINPQDISTLFEPFRQAGDKRHRSEGTGLGLAISQNMVRLMGGELKVKSAPDDGSIFWFDLRLPEIPGWVESAESTRQSIIGYQGKRRKILVVDDVQENRAMLFDLLSPLGVDVLEATSGQEALDKTHQFSPDAILVDLVMPQMSGLDFVRQIRQETSFKDTVIIITSSHVFDGDQQESLAAGCNAFVPKPIQIEVLLAQLQKFLQLEWLYDTQDHEKTVSIRGLAPPKKRLPSDSWHLDSIEALVPPPPEEIAKLFELAQLGDIAAIREQAERLERMDEKFKPFAAELYSLVSGFQVNQLCQFLEKYLT
jgi:CheY-like chemotaxis protein